MEGLIDNAKKFMASEEGQKMQSTFEQQGGADVDQFLGKSSSGDNVISRDSSNPSYGSQGHSSNQYTEQNQNSQLMDESANSSIGTRGQRGDTGILGDTFKTDVRERDTDYSGYGGEDSTAEGGWGANLGGDSFSRQNQLGADKPASGTEGQTEGRTGDNETNYDGGRGASGLDASGTSTPAYRQEDDYEDSGKGGKTQGGGSYGLNPYGDNSSNMDKQNPLHEQHH